MSAANVPLAIVGIGCLFPKADGPGAFWANVKRGVDCVGPVPSTHWKPEDYFDADPKAPDMTYAARGAFLDPVDFDPLQFGISPVDIEAIDTSQLLGLVAARQALNDAGYTPNRKFDKNRISVILGVTGTLELVIPLGARLGHPKWKRALANAGVDAETAKHVVDEIADSYVPWQENSFPGLLGNVVAGRIANKLDLGGTNCVVDAACASSLSAIHLASLELATGRCDVAVTGGVDTFNDIFMYMCFSKTPALSKSGDAKPFDADGDGTILGEGLGMVVLKRLADAERDGDRVYAVLRAIGSSSDGKGNAVYAPSAEGQRRCLLNAYELAGVSPTTVELVEAHGTGTKVGDTVEATALAGVFREAGGDGAWCAVGSVKSMVGHTKAAAGAAGLIKAALALYNKVLPPTIKVKAPVEPLQPGKSPLYINGEMRPWLARVEHPRRAGMSAFGFGGSNFHAVLEEHLPIKLRPDWDGRTQIIPFSAATPAELIAKLATVPVGQSWSEICRFAAQARSQWLSAEHRLVLVCTEDGDLAKLIKSATTKLQSPASTGWSLNEGAYYGRGKAGQLAILFPGQGSQTVGMLRELVCTFPRALEHVQTAEFAWGKPQRLIDYVYPPTAFSPEARANQDTVLRSTDIAQPALGAIETAAWSVLRDFGVRGDQFAGHSYGELVALWAAGAVDEGGLHRLSRERGRLMAEQAGADAGCMVAVHASAEDVAAIVQQSKLQITLANRNSPTQCVLSGTTQQIADAEAAFQKGRIRYTRLPVSAAFHSPLVAAAAIPFKSAIEKVGLSPAKSIVYSNTSAKPYPTEPKAMQELLANQLARPVDFVGSIRAMAEAGARTFLEVGPGSVLGRLASATLSTLPNAADFECISIDSSGGKKLGLVDLAHAFARLVARGHAVDLAAWDAGRVFPSKPSKPGLSIKLSGANYVRPKEPRPVRAPVKPSTPSDAGSPVRQVPPATRPAPPAERKPMSDPSMSGAFSAAQQSLLAFQRMQEETARLHKQFLDHQQFALGTLQALVAQQQSLLSGQPMPVMAMPTFVPAPVAPVQAPMPAPVYAPAPVVPSPAPAPRPVPAPVASKPAPVAAPVPAVPVKKAGIDATGVLMAVVAEKTGYPADMLGLDMSLDADLGIDSIKRVEILSALQEKLPDAPEVKPEHLGSLHSLRDIVQFLGASSPASNAVAPPTPAAPVAAKPAPSANGQEASGVLLAVVAEKTGYPADMLGLDMALDADLGIDSIKRVEILSAIQEKLPGAPEVKPEHLGTLHTLRDIAAFLGGAPPTSTETVASPPMPAPEEAPRPFELALTPGTAESERAFDIDELAPPTAYLPPNGLDLTELPELVPPPLAAVRSEVRAFPISPDAVRPRLTPDRFAPVWLIAEPSTFTSKLSQALASAGLRTQVIPWKDTPFAYEPKELSGLILLAPEDRVADDLPLQAFRWLKRAAPALNNSGRSTRAFFTTIVRLDGSFGLNGLPESINPVVGALAGLAKTASHEWPQVSCKAIDIDASVARHATGAVVEEIMTQGPVEVGLGSRGRFSLNIVDLPIAPSTQVSIEQGDVILVTGGGRGVTAESLYPLARACRPTLVLFGRTHVPDRDPDWLVGVTDEAEIKKALIAQRGRSATPKEIGEECKRIIAQREVRQTLSKFRQLGANAEYVAVDVQDAGQLSAVIADVRKRLGPIRGIVHGAGVLADKRIEDLTEEQFRYVYSTKVVGLRNLLSVTESDDLKAIVLFSSSTGRFGRTGQIAYAAANEVLNKSAQQLRLQRPNCRVVAINWGPWAGGMVTPALAKLFESEGVGLISAGDGGETLLRELSLKNGPAEVVVITPAAGTSLSGQMLAAPSVNGVSASPLAQIFERRLTTLDHPVLRSHVINNQSVLPLVLHLEWMAHAALHGNPGLKFAGVEGLRIFQGVQLDESTPVTIRVLGGKATRREGGQYVVSTEVRGTKGGRDIAHSRAEIVLAEALVPAPEMVRLPETDPFARSASDAYDLFLFHGDMLRGLERIDGIGNTGAVAFSRPAPSPDEWMASPVRNAWLTDPLILDCAFQLMILWSHHVHRAASLPCFVGSYRQYQRNFPTEGALICVRVQRDNGTVVRADIDFVAQDGQIIASMTEVEHVIDRSLNEAFRRGRALPPTGYTSVAARPRS